MKTEEIDLTTYEHAERQKDGWTDKVRAENERIDGEVKRLYQAKVTRAVKRALGNVVKGNDHWWFDCANVSVSIDHSKSPWKASVHIMFCVKLYVAAGIRGCLEVHTTAEQFEDALSRLAKIAAVNE